MTARDALTSGAGSRIMLQGGVSAGNLRASNTQAIDRLGETPLTSEIKLKRYTALAGVLLSVGLMRQLNFTRFEACVKSLYSSGQ